MPNIQLIVLVLMLFRLPFFLSLQESKASFKQNELSKFTGQIMQEIIEKLISKRMVPSSTETTIGGFDKVDKQSTDKEHENGRKTHYNGCKRCRKQNNVIKKVRGDAHNNEIKHQPDGLAEILSPIRAYKKISLRDQRQQKKMKKRSELLGENPDAEEVVSKAKDMVDDITNVLSDDFLKDMDQNEKSNAVANRMSAKKILTKAIKSRMLNQLAADLIQARVANGPLKPTRPPRQQLSKIQNMNKSVNKIAPKDTKVVQKDESKSDTVLFYPLKSPSLVRKKSVDSMRSSSDQAGVNDIKDICKVAECFTKPCECHCHCDGQSTSSTPSTQVLFTEIVHSSTPDYADILSELDTTPEEELINEQSETEPEPSIELTTEAPSQPESEEETLRPSEPEPTKKFKSDQSMAQHILNSILGILRS